MVRVLALSSLFPHEVRPYAGAFVEKQLLELTLRKRVELKVVSPLGLVPFPITASRRKLAQLPHLEVWKGLEVHRFRHPVHRSRPAATVGALAARLEPLFQAIRKDFDFDIIDAQTFWPDGVALMDLERKLGVPFSIKARGEDVDHWGAAPETAPMLVEASRRATGLLAVSQGLRANMIKIGMPAERIRVHYTGLDRALFRPRDRAAAKKRLKVEGPLILSVGNLIPRKGHDVVLEAAALLPKVTLWILGGGPEARRLQAKIDAATLGARVRLLGHVPHAMLPALLAAADVTVLASKEEGLANVWVESLACGTPIVTTDVGGARELITNAAAGRIVDRDPRSIATAVDAILSAPFS